MSQGEIDRFPVNQLQARYGDLARSAVYDRMKGLGIKPTKVGNRAFINAQELQLMDEFHEFIQRGGSLAAFLDMRGMNQDNQVAAPDQNASGLVPSAADMVSLFTNFFERVQPPKALSYLEELERACRERWIISTSDLAKLLKVAPEKIRQYPQGFINGSFAFKPEGRLMNGETGWRVEKYHGGHLKF
ncbi:MAG: hypothetical protein AAGF01_09035 [Cyanobacteria bacterium P01_G01_bin.38]